MRALAIDHRGELIRNQRGTEAESVTCRNIHGTNDTGPFTEVETSRLHWMSRMVQETNIW